MLWKLRAALISDPLIVLGTVIYGSLSMMASLFDKTGFTQHRIARVWARCILVTGGIRVRVEGLEKLEPHGRYVLVSNHLSLTDTPVLMAMLPVQFRFFAKLSLFKIPFLGGHLRRAGHLPVDLDNPRKGLRTLSDGARLLRERNVSVLIFPEGGRTDGVMREFKEGAAYVAIKSGAPVVPVGIKGTLEVLPMGSLLVRPGPVMLRVGDPIPTTGMGLHDRGRLTAELFRQVAALAGENTPVQCN